MKKSGSPTKSYMCNSDNPKMHSSNMGKAGKGYADGGMVPLPPNTRFIGTDKAPMPPVRPTAPAMSQPFGAKLNRPPVGFFSGMPPMGRAPVTPLMTGIPTFTGLTPAQRALEQVKFRKSKGI